MVAPSYEHSGKGHCITLHSPLRVVSVRDGGKIIGYSVDGTPADCVKLGICELMARKPDIVVSGINPGANVGTNIVYSGTVSAALEAALMGYPSVAVSFDGYENLPYAYASELTLQALRALEGMGFPQCVLNINIPAVDPARIKGIKVTRQGFMRYTEIFEKRVDPRGREYYWLDGEIINAKADSESDSYAVGENYVSVTPLFYDFTDRKNMKVARQLVGKLKRAT